MSELALFNFNSDTDVLNLRRCISCFFFVSHWSLFSCCFNSSVVFTPPCKRFLRIRASDRLPWIWFLVFAAYSFVFGSMRTSNKHSFSPCFYTSDRYTCTIVGTRLSAHGRWRTSSVLRGCITGSRWFVQ